MGGDAGAEQSACSACGARLTAHARFCSTCGAVARAADTGPESRKNVAVLFVDLVDSTKLGEQLDPELLRNVLYRYYEACSEHITEHGGLIEKYIGDAIMAVFGVPVTHEDDALRAVRAAWSVVAAVRKLSDGMLPMQIRLDVHCGVSSGEAVVIASPGAQLRIVGDTVNTAARLQSAAQPGQILVNAEVAQLVRGRAGLAELPPLVLKGKAEPERVWRVTSVTVESPAVRAPMIGRAEELRRLLASYGQVVADARGRCLLVHGEPGVGKTRLMLEFAARREVGQALVLTGSCQPYGRDITFHPLISMLHDSVPGGWAHIRQALGASESGRRAYRTLTAVCGGESPKGGPPVGVEEIGWAATHLFRALAARHPLVLVWEDLHWAEGVFLGLIKILARELSDLPVLIVWVARDELLENHPHLGIDQASRVRVAPLSPAETVQLIDTLAVGEAEVAGHARSSATAEIVELSAGNPLFVAAMIDALADQGSATSTPPPTISALLRARIDALPAPELRTLQWAAVCGQEFDVDRLLILAARDGLDREEVIGALERLVRRDFVQPLGAGRLRAQTLIRDTCYAMTAKALRAEAHALLADRTPPTETMYHAERASLLFGEVAPGDPRLPALSAKAVKLLVQEGTTALHRRDAKAAGSLFGRALTLHTGRGRRFADITVRLSEALLAQGEGDRALRVLEEGLRETDTAGRMPLTLQRDIIRFRLGHLSLETAPANLARHESDLRQAADDDMNWCLLHQFAAFVEFSADQVGRAESEFRKALARARLLDEHWIENRLSSALCELVQWSPTTVADGLELCDELLRRFEADRLLLIPVLATQARLLALAGKVNEARAALSAARETASALHAAFPEIAISQSEAILLSLTGDNVLASRRFAEAAAMLRNLGHIQPALTLEIYAVREILRAGHHETARAAFANLSAAEGDAGLVARARTWLHLLQAHFACLDGHPDEGHALARRALDAMAGDDPCLLGDAWHEFAVIARTTGRTSEAALAAARAEAYYLAKGASLPARAVRRWAATDDGDEK
ncbi:AAA family ATPase [Thermoactinospora rubra]|uniref:AAA family ATPase n=1 Tax=Thermoactinospora rubra TaxID=1088767 RepID=UPI001301B276|nr:adenylate/guanylate cyclase domain-containing protein [Thermoactinospora rubra]